MSNIIDTLRKLPFPTNLIVFNRICGYELEPEQLLAQIKMIIYPESAHCWGRQLGKTLTVSLTTLFMSAVLGMRGCYRTPQKAQCDAPLEYWSSTPFYSGKSNDYIRVLGKKMIHLAPITNNSMRSRTVDYLIYDEQAAASRKQELMLLYGQKMVQNSFKRHVIRISTPIVSTGFETDYNRLDGIGQTTCYTYKSFSQESPWIIAAIEEIEETIKLVEAGHYPLHLFQQEVLAMFAPAGGAIFSDYEESYLKYNHFAPIFVGIDVNPKAGHTAIFVRYIHPNIIYVMEELDLGTDTEQAAVIIKNKMTHNTSVRLELNGPGEEAYKVFIKVLNQGKRPPGHFDGEIWSEDAKIQRIMQMMKHHFIFSPACKKTYTQYKAYSWDPNHKLKPVKTPDDHWIDGLLHACHYETQTTGSALIIN